MIEIGDPFRLNFFLVRTNVRLTRLKFSKRLTSQYIHGDKR